jgi:hypothetical protein
MQTVALNPTFLATAKAAGMTEDEIAALIDYLAKNPQAGVVVQGTGGVRKVRFAKTGGGKSGGYRVFFYFAGPKWPVFLWAVISKNDAENLSKAERNELAKVTRTIIENYPKH